MRNKAASSIGSHLPTIYRSLPEFISNPNINPQFAWAPIIVPNWTDCDQFGGADFTRGQDWYDLALAVYPGAPNSILFGGIDLFLCNIVFDPCNGTLTLNNQVISRTNRASNSISNSTVANSATLSSQT